MPEVDGLPTYGEALEDDDDAENQTELSKITGYGENTGAGGMNSFKPSKITAYDESLPTGAFESIISGETNIEEEAHGGDALKSMLSGESKRDEEAQKSKALRSILSGGSIIDEEGQLGGPSKKSRPHKIARQISQQVSQNTEDSCSPCSFTCFLKNFLKFVSPLVMAVPMIYFGAGLYLSDTCPQSWIMLWMLVQGISIATVYLLLICMGIGYCCADKEDESLLLGLCCCPVFLNLTFVVIWNCFGAYWVWTSQPAEDYQDWYLESSDCPPGPYWLAFSATIYTFLYVIYLFYIGCCSSTKEENQET